MFESSKSTAESCNDSPLVAYYRVEKLPTKHSVAHTTIYSALLDHVHRVSLRANRQLSPTQVLVPRGFPRATALKRLGLVQTSTPSLYIIVPNGRLLRLNWKSALFDV